MKRKQIYVEEEQERRLKALARRQGVAEAVLIRQALDRFLEESEFEGFERMEDSPLWQIIGIVDDPKIPTDSSVNLDHYLYGLPKKQASAGQSRSDG